MSKRRGNGEGSICKRKDGLWQCQVTTGFDDNGKPKRKTYYGKTREEVRDKLNEALMKVKTKTFKEPAKYTFGEWVDIWLNDYMKNSLRKTTWESYETQVRLHIKPTLGSIKLVKLQPVQIQRLYNEKREEKSARTVRYIHQVINGALEQAFKERLIDFNPASAVKLPRDSKKEMKTLSKEEVRIFLETAKEQTEKAMEKKDAGACFYYTAYFLVLNTGLRRGEILGLKWKDIDFKKGTLRISRQLVRVKGGFEFTEPKTPLSNRVIPLSNVVIRELERYRYIQTRERLKIGTIYEDNDLICCTKIGRPIEPTNFIRNFKGVLKKAGLDETLRFHDLRHTYAVLAASKGIDVKTIQESLGHHSPAFTMEVYGHSTSDMKKEAAEKMSTLFIQPIEKENSPSKGAINSKVSS